ncbi:catalase family peroxidase [Streptomyces sp. N2-109]|uniref:Catalase-related peroxidase n=1 Tax=Streptomyces gossypii TaxID=2883101 RepID=A0ABT2K2G0_9ACTN|nr:catalase family peroxidase [Streptomyces gossypii]MCT2594335.1 catalase family peroxidase [Streptomyces gossypii]
MDQEDEQAPAAQPRTPSRRSTVLGLATVAGIAAVDVGGFLYVSGRLTPGKLTPARLADGFETTFGKHAGFRRNHAKGVSVSGHFTGNGAGSAVSTATVFESGRRSPVTGRFSLSGGVPDVADTATTVRGLGLRFSLPDGEQWRTAMINIPVFLDSTPRGFYDRMLAFKKVPATGKPDPAKAAAFLAGHPETVKAMKIVKKHPPTSGFADSTYHGLNAFHLTNSSGHMVPVRWSMVPVQQARPAAAKPPEDRDQLFNTLVTTVDAGSLRWRLMLTIGLPGDQLDDATVPWPDSRRQIDAGTLTLDNVQTEAEGNGRDVNFDPLVLPQGIEPSDDPLLSARSAVYAQSFARRSGEPAGTSAVNVSQVLDA